MSERDFAETLALQALTWLAGDRDRLQGFMAASGASPADLARQAGDPAFLGSVLDHLLSADDLVMAFCDAEHIAYDRPMAARAILRGDAQWHWT